MATKYPIEIDNNLSLPKVINLVSPIVASDVNRLQEAIIAIQTELGANPSSTWGSLKDRLDSFASTASVIGEAEDGSYSDGLFTDFNPSTSIGVAVDRFNEILRFLSPSPAPPLNSITWSSASGPECKVSFGAGHSISGYSNVGNEAGGSSLNVNGLFTSLGQRRGVFSPGSTRAGLVAGDVPIGSGTPNAAYAAGSFGDADKGVLELWANGSKVHETDLSAFVSGNSITSGSGFNLSAATSSAFPAGGSLDLFKSRTGSWLLGSYHERPGWNYIRIIHRLTDNVRETNFFEWIVDTDSTNTQFSGVSINNLQMFNAATPKIISGVQYHAGGTANYTAQIENARRNTFSASNTAISHAGSVNCTLSSTVIPDYIANSDVFDVINITNKNVTIPGATGVRILDGSISVKTTVSRPLNNHPANVHEQVAFQGILLDTVADNATDTFDDFNGESYRIPSNADFSVVPSFPSPYPLWVGSTSLVSDTSGYSDGLMVYNSQVVYPKLNFSSITNGPGAAKTEGGTQPGTINPNYSNADGNRVYLRYFKFTGAASNFVLKISGSGTVVPVSQPLTTNDSNPFHVQLSLPGATTDGIVNGKFKDAYLDYSTSTDDGVLGTSYGNNPGNLNNSDWGISFGDKNSGDSNGIVVLKITAPENWGGHLNSVELTKYVSGT